MSMTVTSVTSVTSVVSVVKRKQPTIKVSRVSFCQIYYVQ